MPCRSSTVIASGAQPLQRDPQAPLGLQAEDAVHRRRAHPDQVHPAAQPLTQRAVIERWDPQLGHQIAPAQLGQHTRVDLVALARQRRDVTNLAGMRDLHPPARRREPVAHPDRAAHHLHARLHLRAERQHQLGQPSSSAGTAPSPTITPASLSAHYAARRYAQSIPT
jgi:hypothetical protein